MSETVNPEQVLDRFEKLLGWRPESLYMDGELTHAPVPIDTLEQLLNDHEDTCCVGADRAQVAARLERGGHSFLAAIWRLNEVQLRSVLAFLHGYFGSDPAAAKAMQDAVERERAEQP